MTDHKLEFSQRLKEVIAEQKIPKRGSATILASKFHVSPKAVSKWLNGEAFPELNKLIDISTWCGKSVEWLLTGQDILKDDSESPSPLAANQLPIIKWESVIEYIDNKVFLIENYETLPQLPNSDSTCFYLKVLGYSNTPYFEEGEFICIKPNIDLTSLETGEMVLIRQDNDISFKAIIIESNGLYAKNLNPNWQEAIQKISDINQIIGKYIGSITFERKFPIF